MPTQFLPQTSYLFTLSQGQTLGARIVSYDKNARFFKCEVSIEFHNTRQRFALQEDSQVQRFALQGDSQVQRFALQGDSQVQHFALQGDSQVQRFELQGDSQVQRFAL